MPDRAGHVASNRKEHACILCTGKMNCMEDHTFRQFSSLLLSLSTEVGDGPPEAHRLVFHASSIADDDRSISCTECQAKQDQCATLSISDLAEASLWLAADTFCFRSVSCFCTPASFPTAEDASCFAACSLAITSVAGISDQCCCYVAVARRAR